MFSPHTPRSSSSGPTSLALATCLALLASGCTNDAETPDELAGPPMSSPAPDASPSPTVDTSPTPTPTPTSESEAPADPSSEPAVAPTPVDAPDLDARCTIEPDTPGIDRIAYAVPATWRVEGRCDILDPELDELPEDTEVDAAVLVSVADTAFARAAGDRTASQDVTRYLGARAGLQAFRETSVTTGEGLGPAGVPVTRWLVDLDADSDDQGGVLTLSTGASAGADHALAATVLDRVAQTLVIERADADVADGDVAVTRTEGGATPFTVTFDGDCFALRLGGPGDSASDEVCDLDPTSGDIVTATLGDDLLVGHAPPTAVAVEVADGGPPFGATTAIEGSSVFAFPVSGGVGEVTALAAGGVPIATVRTP